MNRATVSEEKVKVEIAHLKTTFLRETEAEGSLPRPQNEESPLEPQRREGKPRRKRRL
jgi:hypothetical protein